MSVSYQTQSLIFLMLVLVWLRISMSFEHKKSLSGKIFWKSNGADTYKVQSCYYKVITMLLPVLPSQSLHITKSKSSSTTVIDYLVIDYLPTMPLSYAPPQPSCGYLVCLTRECRALLEKRETVDTWDQ